MILAPLFLFTASIPSPDIWLGVRKPGKGERVQLDYPDDRHTARQMDDKALLTLAALRGEGCSLELAFQPILPVTASPSGSATATWFEALLRLRLSQDKLLRPAEFMPPDVVGNIGLLAAIDFWVLEQVSVLLHTTTHTYSVNFSRYMLADPLIVNRVKSLVNGYGNRLVLEVSEKYRFSEAEIESMLLLRPVVRLCLDDVGVGRLEYLARLPLTGFKIDGSLIQHVATEKRYQDLVRTLLTFAFRQQLNCVCEFVCTEEIWLWLRRESCQLPGVWLFVQGEAVGEAG